MECTLAEHESEIQLELCDLQNDATLINKVCKMEFWNDVSKQKYPKITDCILKYLSMFSSTYTCEYAFSAMKNIRSTKRSSLTNHNLENLLKIAVNESIIDFEKLVKLKVDQ